MSIGTFPERLSQRILVGIILVGRLGVLDCPAKKIELIPRGEEGCTIALHEVAAGVGSPDALFRPPDPGNLMATAWKHPGVPGQPGP